MRRPIVSSILVVLVSALTAACAGTYADNPFQGGSNDNDVQITIRNQNFNDATIWAEGGAARGLDSGP